MINLISFRQERSKYCFITDTWYSFGLSAAVFYHHQKTLSETFINAKKALELATSTWPEGITPVVHYSESKAGGKPQAHSDYIESLPQTYGNNVDIMVEAKAKELAILQFIK